MSTIRDMINGDTFACPCQVSGEPDLCTCTCCGHAVMLAPIFHPRETPTLSLGVDVEATSFDSGEGRIEYVDHARPAPYGVRWDRTGRLGWCDAEMLRVVGQGVS